MANFPGEHNFNVPGIDYPEPFPDTSEFVKNDWFEDHTVVEDLIGVEGTTGIINEDCDRGNVNPCEIHDFLQTYYAGDPELNHLDENYPSLSPEGSNLGRPRFEPPRAYDGASVSDASEQAGTTTTAPAWVSSNTSITSYTSYPPYTESAVTDGWPEISPEIPPEETGYDAGGQLGQSVQGDDLGVSHVGGGALLPQTPVSTQMLAVPSPSLRSGPGRTRVRKPLGEKREKVAKVRENKACVRCHIRHVSCDVDETCRECEKYLQKIFPRGQLSDEDHLRVCTKQHLAAVRFPPGRAINIWSDPNGPMPFERGKQCFGAIYPVDVAFSSVAAVQRPPLLQLPLQRYMVAGDFGITQGAPAFLNYTHWAIPRMSTSPGLLTPTAPDLVAWSEGQLLWEGRSTFQSAIGSFLHHYSKHSPSLPELDLVRKTHEMRCWYRIWMNPMFVLQDFACPLPSAAHAQIRSIAGSVLKSHEESVLKRLNGLYNSSIEKEMLLPPWACFWQLMLLYRDLKMLYTHRVPTPNRLEDLNSRQETLDLLEQLLTLLIVQYSTHFANHSPVHYSHEKRATALGNSLPLLDEFENVCNKRKEFLMTSTFDASDRYLEMLVVNHERDLDRRRSKKARR